MKYMINKTSLLGFNENSKTKAGGEKRKLNKNKLVLSIVAALALLVIVPISAEAQQQDTNYTIESENISIVIETNSINNTLLVDIGFQVNDTWIFVTDENITVSRNASDNQSGKFFGYTDSGNAFLLLYDILNEDSAKLSVKVWHDGTKTSIVERATVQYLSS